MSEPIWINKLVIHTGDKVVIQNGRGQTLEGVVTFSWKDPDTFQWDIETTEGHWKQSFDGGILISVNNQRIMYGSNY